MNIFYALRIISQSFIVLLHFTLFFFVCQILVFFKLLSSCDLLAATKYLMFATDLLRKTPLLFPVISFRFDN